MASISPHWKPRFEAAMRRFDRIAADLNIVLAVFAIGLAVLDVTFLTTQHIVDRLPEITRVTYVDPPTAAGPSLGQRGLP